MALWTTVELNDNGQVSEDDGQTSWASTLVLFGFGRRGVTADVHVDGYSGDARATITRDDFSLPAQLLEQLAIRLYRVCGSAMRENFCDIGMTYCEMEGIVGRLFYNSDAERLLRKSGPLAPPVANQPKPH